MKKLFILTIIVFLLLVVQKVITTMMTLTRHLHLEIIQTHLILVTMQLRLPLQLVMGNTILMA